MIEKAYFRIFNKSFRVISENQQIIEIYPSKEFLQIQEGYAAECVKQLKEYFSGKRKQFSLNISLAGTENEKKVYRLLLSVPYGQTITYQELAKLYGNVNSSRFIGNCMRKNRLLFILPCHRVVKKNRAGNYLLGEDFKNWLLNLEKSHISDFIHKDV